MVIIGSVCAVARSLLPLFELGVWSNLILLSFRSKIRYITLAQFLILYDCRSNQCQ